LTTQYGLSSSIQFTFNSLSSLINDYSPIIISCDFNAEHRAWNNFSNNSRGVHLYSYLQRLDISIIHSNTFLHKAPRKNPSNIDIFLTKDVYIIIVIQ